MNCFTALQDAQGVCTCHKTRLIKGTVVIATLLKEEKTNQNIHMRNSWYRNKLQTFQFSAGAQNSAPNPPPFLSRLFLKFYLPKSKLFRLIQKLHKLHWDPPTINRWDSQEWSNIYSPKSYYTLPNFMHTLCPILDKMLNSLFWSVLNFAKPTVTDSKQGSSMDWFR